MLAPHNLVIPLAAALALLVAAPADPAAAAPRRTGRATRPARPARTPARRPAQKPRVPVSASVVLPPNASARDREIGEAARRGLGGTHGSVVAMDPYTGRVIAIVNPAEGLRSAYQPCSVFKIVVAIAGLTEGVITPETQFDCHGGTCWMWAGHGPMDLRRALAQSCNPYFEQVGERLGYAKVQRYAQLLGLGVPSGINLPDEAGGRIPDTVSQSKVGHLSSHAAGISTTALQLGVLLSAAVNGGTIFQPQMDAAKGFVPRERWRLPENTVMTGLAEGFLGAVNEGSAASAFDPDVIVAGKTGTCAGVGWFASYAPADKPEVVVVVFVRPGNGHLASSVAGQVYQNLYKPQMANGGAEAARPPTP